MWEWRQKTGEIARTGDNESNVVAQGVVAQGYSGFGRGKNNPDYQSVPDVGPIPQGLWTIGGPPVDTDTHGPYVLHLAPCENTNTFGRSGFLIHGDSLEHPGEASHGCIILPRATRERIWQSNDRQLTVL
jgi:hypothetical protein